MKKTFVIIFSIIGISSCSYKYTPDTSVMINATNYEIGDLSNLKSGESCSTTILGISAPNSSTSIIDAMKNGNITKIKMVDRRFTSSIGFYKSCIIVHGL